MHSVVDVIGPGAVAFIAVIFAIGLLSLYVFADSIRRKGHDYAGVREGRWFYTVPQGLYLVAFILSQIPFVARVLPWTGYVQIIGAPIALVQQVAYLLRVSFPTRERLDARIEAKAKAVAIDPGRAHTEEDDTSP